MADFKALIDLIGKSVIDFNNQIPGIQQRMLNDILLLTKKLDVKDDKIKVAGSNLRLLSQLQSRLQKVILNADYIKNVKNYLSTFDQIVEAQNKYFTEIETKFKPPKLVKEIKKQAVQSVVANLTETGLNANVVDKISTLVRQATTSGGSYNTLNKQLTDFLTNNASGEGQLLKYTKQMSTDALNQFSGQYSQLVSSDLGMEWYRYSGSNIETSRPFCLACVERKFFHISELPKILKGDFKEFRKQDGKINKKTELPEGMIPGTDVTNFMTYRGGYNCGHQWRPCGDDIVPEQIKQRVYGSTDYKQWARSHAKTPVTIASKKEEEPKNSSAASVENQNRTVQKIKENNRYDLRKMEERGIVFYDEVARHMPEDVKIISSNTSGSYYKPESKTMVIGGGERAKNGYYQEKIMLHEGGHAIHVEKGIITTNKISPEFNAFYNRLRNVIAGKEKELDELLFGLGYSNYKDQTKTEQIAILHDTLGGLTKGRFGAGHSRSYYKQGNLSEMEVFAHSITLAKLDNEFSSAHPALKEMTDAMKEYGLNVLK